MNYKQQLKNELIQIYGKDPETLDEVANACMEVIEHQLNSKELRNRRSRSSKSKDVKLDGFAWDIQYSDKVSNSHNAPINGTTNWSGRDKDAPTSYPGFSGRVWIRYSKDPDTWGSDPFPHTLTYTGTGGYGGYNGPWEKAGSAYYKKYGRKTNDYMYYLSWDYRFFLSDFPALEKNVQNNILLHNIQYPNTKYRLLHLFEWTDPETLKQDEEVINSLTISLL